MWGPPVNSQGWRWDWGEGGGKVYSWIRGGSKLVRLDSKQVPQIQGSEIEIILKRYSLDECLIGSGANSTGKGRGTGCFGGDEIMCRTRCP